MITMVNRKIIADKVLSYMNYQCSSKHLVVRAKSILTSSLYECDNKKVSRNALAQFELVDVKCLNLIGNNEKYS